MNAPLHSPRIAAHDIHPMFTARWSPRSFTDDTLPEDELLTMLEAARWAPSASNHQPWRFAWGLRGDEGFDAILGGLLDFNAAWAGKAAALVAVASKATVPGANGAGDVANRWHGFDAGAAWSNLALQAHLSGYAAHAMGGFDHDRAAAALNLPKDHHLHAIVAIGRQGEASVLPEKLRAREVPNARLPLSQIARRGTFA